MNLIICTTPLQMLIAEKIIKKFHSEKFYLLIITPCKNDKYLFYYNRLARQCDKANYIKLFQNKGKLFTFINLVIVKLLGFTLPKMEIVLLANIENLALHTLLSSFRYSYEVRTFDDGTANLLKTSYLYQEHKLGTLQQYILKLLDVDYSILKLKNRSRLHYSIYKGYSNIIDKIENISLFSKGDGKKLDYYKEVRRIFLGQPLYQFNKELYKDISRILQKYNIEYYYPHPRENSLLYKNTINIIHTDKIFEDYLIEEIKNNKDICFEIYTLYSSTILNVKDFSNVTVSAVWVNNCPEDLNPLYEIFSKLGIKIEYLDN